MKKYWYPLVLSVVLTVILIGCGPEPVVNPNFKTEFLTSTGSFWVPVARVIDVQAGVVCYVGDDWGACFLLEETKLDY